MTQKHANWPEEGYITKKKIGCRAATFKKDQPRLLSGNFSSLGCAVGKLPDSVLSG